MTTLEVRPAPTVTALVDVEIVVALGVICTPGGRLSVTLVEP